MVKQAASKKMLNRKLFRDVMNGWKSFMAVLIICMLAVTLYIGINATALGMEKSLDAQFSACNMSDIWIAGELSDRQTMEIAGLPGVLDAQRRVVGRATAVSLPGEPDLDLYMSDGAARINRPMLFEGEEFPEGEKNLCVLSDAFAAAHNLKTGDRLSVCLYGTPIELTIFGIGHQSEYVVYSDGRNMKANAKRFGYATVSPGTLAMFHYTGATVTLSSGADAGAVKESIEALMDDAQKKVTLREDKMGIRMAIEEVEQILALGQVFPAVFFFVAALFTFSTMKRLVDNQRQQIGTLRSMGYGQGELIWHYTSYGLWISMAGAGLGILLAYFFLGRTVVKMLSGIYVLPDANPYLDPATCAAIFGLTVAIAAGASFLSGYRALTESPSALLRPKPPAKARRVFLEYIKFLWKHLSFSNKMLIRNIQRNLPRFFIGLVGVVGCTSLLLTGFGMRDSVKYVLDNHYGYTMRYDVRVALDEPLLQDDYLASLRKRAGAETMESMMETGIEVLRDGAWQSKQMTVLSDDTTMVRIEDVHKNAVALPTRGALITEKFSDETGIKVGDTVSLRSLSGTTASVRVEGMITMQLGQGLYLSRLAFRHLDIGSYSPTALLLKGGAIDPEAISDMDGVDVVRTLSEDKTINSAITQSLDLVVLLMMLFSGALALVVLYTLAQLNFFERQRELATLMVLGFYPRENKRVILHENMVIAVLGIPIGLLAGPYLHAWVLSAGLPNTLEFIPYIARSSWILTPVITLAFAQVVNLMMGGKFEKVDMVEALKSVE